MNNVVLVGRLTADPEVRQTQSGIAVAYYTLAVDRPRKAEQGQQTADFPRIVAWRHNAEFAGQYFRKGMRIALKGHIETGSYTKEDGTKVYTTDIIAEHQEFCESRREQQDGVPATNYAAPEAPQSYASTYQQTGMHPVEDDELPF